MSVSVNKRSASECNVPLQLVVTAQKSTLRAEALGSAEEAYKMEGRYKYHSHFQPSGRYVRRGTVLTVTVEPSVRGLELVIGLYGQYAKHNDGKVTGRQLVALNPGQNRIEALVDGMVYVQNRIYNTPATVEIYGGQPVPTYVKGVTSRADFDVQVETWNTAPFFVLVGEYVLFDVQMVLATSLPGLDLDRRIEMMDSVVATTNALYGLSKYANDAAHKSAHRIHIINPDVGPGYASATDYHITFQNATAAGRHLLAGPENDQWGFYHEVGHTYQMKEFNYRGAIEVTVNIPALAVQEAQGYPNRIDSVSVRNAVAQFRETPIAERNFLGLTNGWVQLLMFDQLRRGFGADFYARLSQQFRLVNAKGTPEPPTDLAVMQHFMITAATVAERDLTPFFEEWGMPLEADTRSKLARFSALRHPIWHNMDRSTDLIESNLSPLEVPGTLTSPAEGALFDVNHVPVFKGRGAPGAMVTLEQAAPGGDWERVGTTTIDACGNWLFIGQCLTVGERKARATLSHGGTGFAVNAFTVAQAVTIPLTLMSPVGSSSFDTHHAPVYAGRGTPGARVTIEQGMTTGAWYPVGATQVDTNGDWSLTGQKLPAASREARATQSNGASGSDVTTFTVTAVPPVLVTLSSPVEGALFDVNHEPVYRGRGTPGATVIIEQRTGSGSWVLVGGATVNSSGDWTLAGEKLVAAEYQARATQSGIGASIAVNAFTVARAVEVRVTLTSPERGATFDEHHIPVYQGRGTPGAMVTVQQGTTTGQWYRVGEVRVNTNGDWSCIGQKLPAATREARALQGSDNSVSTRNTFTVTKVQVPVTLLSPGAEALFDVNHVPVYQGRGTPGAMITINQGTDTGDWYVVGTVLVGPRGDWSLVGKKLTANRWGVAAVQNNDHGAGARHSFNVEQVVQTPVTLTFPVNGGSFDEHHAPTYAGKGTPGATVAIEQGTPAGRWRRVGRALVNTSGDWSHEGLAFPAGPREVRVTQNGNSADSVRIAFSVTPAIKSGGAAPGLVS